MKSSAATDASSPIESLDLPLRALNTLHAMGCETIADVLRLDLSAPIRGLGSKSREGLRMTLERAGFPHPVLESEYHGEIRILDRKLKRMETRIGTEMSAVIKEIRRIRDRLRKHELSKKDSV